MPVTPQATASAETALTKILAPYDSAEGMTIAQLKQLGTLSFSLIASDITKGFAQKLVEGELVNILALGLEQKRRDWRILHSRMREVFECVVPAVPQASVGEYLGFRRRREEDGTRIKYLGTRASAYSVWGEKFPSRPFTAAMAYTVTGEVDRERFVEALGGKNLMANHGAFEQLCLTPAQVIAILDDDKGRLADEGAHFLIGQSAEGLPLFMIAWREGERSLWAFREYCWNDLEETLDEGDIVVFRQSIFIPPR